MKSISKIIAMFLLLIPFVANAEASTLQQDNKSVTVIVSDNVGVMPGANVVVKGTTNGTIAVSNNSYRIACPRNDTVNADKLRVRFELYGPKANVYATTINASSTTYPTNLTIVLRPGADGYTVAPLRGKTVNIYGGIFDIDMREAIQSVEPGEVLRMPIAKATTTLNVSDLELLNQNAILKPDGAYLEVVNTKTDKALYFVARRQKGLMILVR